MAAEKKNASTVTPEQLLAAAEADPNGFVTPRYDQAKQGGPVTYIPVTFKHADGKVMSTFSLVWKQEKTSGKIKPFAERGDKDASFMYQQSSKLGGAIKVLYTALAAAHKRHISSLPEDHEWRATYPVLKTKTVLQTTAGGGNTGRPMARLDDPIVRAGLKFKKPQGGGPAGEPLFTLSTVVVDPETGKPKLKPIRGITVHNIHNYGLAHTITSCTSKEFSMTLSTMGASVPFSVQSGVIKLGKRDVPDIAKEMNDEELAALVADDDGGAGADDDADAEGKEEGVVPVPVKKAAAPVKKPQGKNTKTVLAQLDNLTKMVNAVSVVGEPDDLADGEPQDGGDLDGDIDE